MSAAARGRLLAFDWPGNVRQLRNVVESMVVVDYDGVLDVDDLPSELCTPSERPTNHAATASMAWSANPFRKSSGCSLPRRWPTGGNREAAAEMLGIGERTLYRKIKEYHL